MARLYANENFPRPGVDQLRRLGHDVLTTLEAGKAGQAVSDEEVLSFAVHEARAVLTLNRKHFVHLHREKPEHSGIVVCTFDRDFVAQAKRIHVEITRESKLTGKLIRINRPRSGHR